MANDAQVISVVKAEVSWLKAHERIVLCFMVLLAVGWLGNKWLDRKATETAATATIAQAAATQAQSAAALAAADYKVTLSAMQTEIAALNHQQTQRTVILQTKQESIKTAPVPEVTAEWQRLLGIQGEILPRPDGLTGAIVTENVVRQTVSELESVPVLQSNLTDETKITADTKQALDKSNALVLSLNSELVTGDKACKAEIASVKATANRSKRNWFVLGFIAGIGTRILGKF